MKLNKKIYKKSVGYTLIRSYVRFMMRLFYKKIEVKNMEVIPENSPVILAINHQNALMDALTIGYILKKQPIFVARADIFNPKTLPYLMFIKILPIFRIRDGAIKLKMNEDVFNIVTEGLKKNNILGIMPEGSHGDKRKLRPLKKGVFRIAFSVQEEYKDQPGLKIIPVGLEFSDYIKSRSTLFINFGEPMEIADYYKEYKKNKPITINSAIKDLSSRMSQVMIDIQQEEFYDSFDFLRKMFRPVLLTRKGWNKNRLKNQFLAEKQIIDKLNQLAEESPEEMKILKNIVDQYKNLLQELNINDPLLHKKRHNPLFLFLQFILFVMILPLHLYGMVNNYLPYKIPVWHTRKKVKDPQFISSFRFVLAFLLFPVFYFVQTITVSLFNIFPFFWLVYLFSLPVTGMLSLHYYIQLKKWFVKIRYTLLDYYKNEKIVKAKHLRVIILEKMKKIVFS